MKDIINGLRLMLTREDKFRFLGVIVLLSIGALLEIAGLGLLLPLVAAFTKPELLEQNRILCWFRHFFGALNDAQFMLLCCALIVLLYLFKNLWIFFSIHIYTNFVYARLAKIACRLYSGFLNCRYQIFADRGKVDLSTCITKVEAMCTMVMLPIMMITVDLLTIVFIAAMLIITIPWIVLGCSAIFIVGSALIYFPLRRLSSRIGEEINQLSTRINKLTYYSLEDIKSIRVLGADGFFSAAFRKIRLRKSRYDSYYYILGQVPRLALEILAVFAAVLMLSIMLWRGVPAGTVILSFSLLIAAMSRMLPAFSRITYSLNSIRIGYPCFNEIMAAMKLEKEDLGSESAMEYKSEITVKNLSFAYPGTERNVIRDLSFSLKRNSSIAIVGPTGGGKSTLIDLLLGLYKPQSGEILVDGRNIHEHLGAWRRLIGFVPQFIVLADASIAANVALGVEENEIDRARVMEVLRIAQLEDFAGSLPEGIDTFIGDNGIRLSGGQRQRLGIARALYRDPEIIIFDEATSALDNETEEALIKAVEELQNSKTLIMVAHRLSTVEKCEQRIEIKPQKEDSAAAH